MVTDWRSRLARCLDDGAALASLGRELEESEDFQDVDPLLLSQLGDKLLATGSVLLAASIARSALSTHADEPSLQRVFGLALARMGASQRALVPLRRALSTIGDAPARIEVLGALARALKDIGIAEAAVDSRTRLLEESRALYQQGYELHDSVWAGVNAAALSVLLGDARAASLARQVRSLAEAQVRAECLDPYWAEASIAECLLIEGELARAAQRYRQAAQMAHASGRTGDYVSTRQQALRLLNALGRPRGALEIALPAPRVLVFSGHRFDEEGRPDRRLPRDREDVLETLLGAHLDTLVHAEVYSSLSEGADLVFVEQALLRGIPVHLVLPCPAAALRLGLARRDAEEFIPRVCECLEQARTITVATPRTDQPSPADYNYCNELLVGSAKLRARDSGGVCSGVVVWDGKPVEHVGGTYDAVRCMRSAGISPHVLWPGGSNASVAELDDSPRASSTCAFLFADFQGYSALNEDRVQEFVDVVWKDVARRLDQAECAGRGALAANTWGDGLFLVFGQAGHAAAFALEFCGASHRYRAGAGFPGMHARVALHAGPAREYLDPVTHRTNYFGTHVAYASRLEPVTPPEEVFASQHFAAMLFLENPRVIDVEFVGIVDWAKGSGPAPTYRCLDR